MKHYVLTLLVAIGLLLSCGFSESIKGDIEYVPFCKGDSNRNWGVVSTDGTIVFQGMNRVKYPNEDCFFKIVDEHESTWELYTTEAKPKKIGGPYVLISPFENGVAVVQREGKPIEFIDTKGKVVLTFNKVKGKTVINVNEFKHGLAPFKTSDDYWGIVDTKGNIILEPRYFATMVAGDRLTALELNNVSEEERLQLRRDIRETILGQSPPPIGSLLPPKGKVHIFTLDGKEVGVMNASIYNAEKDGDCFLSYLLMDFQGDKTILISKAGGTYIHPYKGSIINDKGETVFVLSSTPIHGKIVDFKDRRIIYTPLLDDDTFGLMDLDGKVLIPPVYKRLKFSGADGVLIANDGQILGETCLLDEKGTVLTGKPYHGITPFFKNGLAFAISYEDGLVLIDNKGEKREKIGDTIKIQLDYY